MRYPLFVLTALTAMRSADMATKALPTPSVPASHAQGYLPHLDGVRGISILLVVLSHVGLGWLVPGGLGVTVFFFISGYLITSLLREERKSTGTISLSRFYMRRLWRLYPALLVYAGMAMAFSIMVGQHIPWSEPLYAIFYASNYFNLFHGYTAVHGTYSPFGIQGSLAIEEHFYLLFAPLVLMIRKERSLIAVLAAMLLIPLGIRLAVMSLVTPVEFAADYTYGATECRLDCIAYGCLLAMIDWPVLTKGKSKALAAIGFLLILVSLAVRDEYFRQTYRFSLQGIGLFLFFLPVIFSNYLEWIRGILSNMVLVFVGKLSYSIYLYHWLVIIALRVLMGDISLSFSWQTAFWVMTAGCSLFSYYLIERPCLNLRRKYGSHV